MASVSFFLVSVGGIVHAEDSFTTTTNYYMVSGSTAREIRESIDKSRPATIKPGTDGQTAWQVNWHTRMTQANGQWKISSLQIITTVNITMPSWQAPTNAEPELVKRWVAFFGALQRHEQNHARSAALAAEALRQEVGAVGSNSDRSALQKQVEAVADSVIARYRKRDADYDTETGHGRKEGAQLP